MKSYGKTENPHWASQIKPSNLLTRSFINFLKKEKTHKGKILEIGCGNGRDSIHLARLGYDVVAIDIVPKALALVKENKKLFLKNKNQSKKLRFIVADAEKLPFRGESFDAVYSIGVLHCTNLNRSLEEAIRVLKTDGVGLIHLWEETLIIKTDKVKTFTTASKIRSILGKLPVKIVKFRNMVTTNKVDYDKAEKNAHKHYAVIFSFKKMNKPQSGN